MSIYYGYGETVKTLDMWLFETQYPCLLVSMIFSEHNLSVINGDETAHLDDMIFNFTCGMSGDVNATSNHALNILFRSRKRKSVSVSRVDSANSIRLVKLSGPAIPAGIMNFSVGNYYSAKCKKLTTTKRLFFNYNLHLASALHMLPTARVMKMKPCSYSY